MDPEQLEALARREIEAVLADLPPELRTRAADCPLALEGRPGNEELEGDELGVFEGASLSEEGGYGEMTTIRLFLENILEYADGDEGVFLAEVRTTYLHELGHYFGWDEEQIAGRGLE